MQYSKFKQSNFATWSDFRCRVENIHLYEHTNLYLLHRTVLLKKSYKVTSNLFIYMWNNILSVLQFLTIQCAFVVKYNRNTVKQNKVNRMSTFAEHSNLYLLHWTRSYKGTNKWMSISLCVKLFLVRYVKIQESITHAKETCFCLICPYKTVITALNLSCVIFSIAELSHTFSSFWNPFHCL